MKILPIILPIFLLVGCTSKPGRVSLAAATSLFGGKTPVVTAANPENAEKSADVSTVESRTEAKIEAGTRMTVPATVNGEAFAMVIELPSMLLSRNERSVGASASAPRPPDKSVELRKEDNSARMPLLYAAIGAAGLAVVSLFLRFPSVAALCGIAAGVFFAAWNAAGLPQWFWMVGVAAIAIGAGIYFGYEKRGQDNVTNER